MLVFVVVVGCCGGGWGAGGRGVEVGREEGRRLFRQEKYAGLVKIAFSWPNFHLIR